MSQRATGSKQKVFFERLVEQSDAFGSRSPVFSSYSHVSEIESFHHHPAVAPVPLNGSGWCQESLCKCSTLSDTSSSWPSNQTLAKRSKQLLFWTRDNLNPLFTKETPASKPFWDRTKGRKTRRKANPTKGPQGSKDTPNASYQQVSNIFPMDASLSLMMDECAMRWQIFRIAPKDHISSGSQISPSKPDPEVSNIVWITSRSTFCPFSGVTCWDFKRLDKI